MKYAIIKIAGQQLKVSEGQSIVVNKLPNKQDEKFEIKEVLFLRNEDEIFFGMPFVEDSVVTVKVIRHFQGEKIDVYKFKSKVRYRKHIGFRPQLTELIVEQVGKKGELTKKEVRKETPPKKNKRKITKKAA